MASRHLHRVNYHHWLPVHACLPLRSCHAASVTSYWAMRSIVRAFLQVCADGQSDLGCSGPASRALRRCVIHSHVLVQIEALLRASRPGASTFAIFSQGRLYGQPISISLSRFLILPFLSTSPSLCCRCLSFILSTRRGFVLAISVDQICLICCN